MTDKRPLNVRCAEALGWRDVRETREGWIGVAPGVPICSEPVFPYGDESSAGWACTGPLIPRFDLCLSVNLKEWSIYDAAEGNEAGLFDSPCSAVAEWVARYGKEALDASRTT